MPTNLQSRVDGALHTALAQAWYQAIRALSRDLRQPPHVAVWWMIWAGHALEPDDDQIVICGRMGELLGEALAMTDNLLPHERASVFSKVMALAEADHVRISPAGWPEYRELKKEYECLHPSPLGG